MEMKMESINEKDMMELIKQELSYSGKSESEQHKETRELYISLFIKE